MLILAAKIPIPFVVYSHPAPWIFLLLSALVVGFAVNRFYQGGLVDPSIGGSALLFCYSGYHMVGGFTNDRDPFFTLGLVGCLGSAGYAAAVLRSTYQENARVEAEAPQRRAEQRDEGARNLMNTLGCTRERAMELLDQYQDDDVKAIMAVRQTGLPTAAPVPGGTAQAPAVVEGSPFDPVTGFAVLQKAPQPKNFAQLAKLFASVTTVNVHDASQQLRNHRGAIIMPNLNEAACEAFRTVLRAEGIETLRLPMSQMLRFNFCGETKSLGYAEAGLTITSLTDQSVTVPWQQMLLLSIGLFNATMVPDPQGLVDIRKGILAADLFVLKGDDCFQFAIDPKRLNYAHLEKRMEATGLANFRITVADLVERAPQLRNGAVDALLGKSMARSFKSTEDFAGESTGLLQLVQAHRLGLS